MENLPSVLIIGVHNNEAEDILKLITGKQDITEKIIENNVAVYKWQIDNKYYVANIGLCVLNSKNFCKKLFTRSIEAIIFYSNYVETDGIDELDDWITLLNCKEAPIKCLICRNSSSKIGKELVESWCMKKNYELIELENNERNDRLIEILHSHEWPNLLMKGNNVTNNQNEITDLENIEGFSALIKNMQSMKCEIASLTGEERLNKAEQVVRAFWSAINGDEDEFSDSCNEVENSNL